MTRSLRSAVHTLGRALPAPALHPARQTLAVAVTVLFSPSAWAATRDCALSNYPFACRLNNILHALYVIAFMLALVLAGVILFAVHLFRKSKSDRSSIP